jgi:hypothetical protein
MREDIFLGGSLGSFVLFAFSRDRENYHQIISLFLELSFWLSWKERGVLELGLFGKASVQYIYI